MEAILSLFFDKGAAYDSAYLDTLQVLTGMIAIVTLGGAAAFMLTYFSRLFPSNSGPVVEQVNQLLPQTQCAQCGFPGCLPYAEAIVAGDNINLCPPGGQETVDALAKLLGRSALSLENDTRDEPRTIVRIRESECIGCTLCLPACPVDAIIGAPQLLHSVIEQTCTGCDLCLEPCPVDCIDIIVVKDELAPDNAVLNKVAPDQIVTKKPAKQAKALPKQPLPTMTECIRCDACETKCPKDLAPQALYWAKGSLDMLQALKIDDCIECKLCDRACPSNLPLTQIFIDEKARIQQRKVEFVEAERLQVRYEKHAARVLAQSKKLRSRPNKSDRSAILQSLIKENTDTAVKGPSE
jgi:electron transport complex protein RnfB